VEGHEPIMLHGLDGGNLGSTYRQGIQRTSITWTGCRTAAAIEELPQQRRRTLRRTTTVEVYDHHNTTVSGVHTARNLSNVATIQRTRTHESIYQRDQTHMGQSQ
jgi:hypothetical protein